MTVRGVFLVMLLPAVIGCIVGFLQYGAVAIPAAAGWGLLLGSLAAGLLASPRTGWFPVFLPPVAMLVLVVTLGQVTLIGSRPTAFREFAMVVAGLTAMAPAQVLSVVVLGGTLLLRHRVRDAAVPAGVSA